MCSRQSRRRSVRPFRMAAAVPVLPTAEEVVALSMQLQPLRSADAVVALARAMARFPSGMPERAAAVADCMLKAGVAAAQCAMDQVTRLLERLRSSLQQWLEFVPSVDFCLAPTDTMVLVCQMWMWSSVLPRSASNAGKLAAGGHKTRCMLGASSFTSASSTGR